MNFEAIKTLDVLLRVPRLFSLKNKRYILGSSLINSEGSKKQYWTTIYELDEDWNIKQESKRLLNFFPRHDINHSTWVRNINHEQDRIYFNLELKINENNEGFYHENYLISTSDLVIFNVEKKYDTRDFLFCTLENDTVSIISKIEKDGDFIWGKYLFEFIIHNKKINPQFDSIIDYEKDKGHVLHNVILFTNNVYIVLITIRHLISGNDFIYKVYSAKTKDFIQFYETRPVEIKNNKSDTKWYSYPSFFKFGDKFYGVSNQDDFGKEKKVLLFDVELIH